MPAKMTDFGKLDGIYPLPYRELYRQWLLSHDRAAAPEDWIRHSIDDWHLAAHPDAHVCELRSKNGSQLGWVIEPLLYVEPDKIQRPGATLTLPVETHDIGEAEIERAFYGRDAAGCADGTGLQGMWIAILLRPFARLYLGPIHSVVYDAEKHAVAPTHNLFGPVERDMQLSLAYDPLATFSFYSFGLTAFKRVRRLLPNHYLDLKSFKPVRHWPKHPLDRLERGEQGAAAMVESGRHLLSGISGQADRFVVPLSAGNDSRAVLVLLRELARAGHPVELFTSVGVDFSKRIDVQGARRLAKIAGLPHEVRPRERHEDVPELLVMRNFARIGEAKATPILSNPGTLKEKGTQSAFTVAGMGGETGRATYWASDLPKNVLPEDLLRRIGSPVIPATIAAARAWLEGLPEYVKADPADTLDFAYLEQRLGCWEANSRYLFPGRPRVISPMVSSFCIETMLRLPHSYRQSGRLQRDMVAYGWPELLKVPINRATGALFMEQKARGLLRRTRRIVERAVG